MEKFAINLENVKKNVLFDCILMGSEVARKYKYKKFYTNDQEEPENWYEEFINDLRTAIKYIHQGQDFYVSHPISDEMYKSIDSNAISYIFFQNRVYSFDNYYTDCPIFAEILKSY